MGPKLRRAFCCEEGFFRRSPGAYQHGWRRATFTREFWCRQAILCLESGAIKDVAACSLSLCVFWISPRDSPSTVSLVTIFQRNERGFEALVLTLVSNLALICDHLSPSAQFMGCPKRLIKIEPKPTFTKICCVWKHSCIRIRMHIVVVKQGQDHLELPSGVGTKRGQQKPIKVRQWRGQDWPNLVVYYLQVLRNGCKWGWGHDRLIVALSLR